MVFRLALVTALVIAAAFAASPSGALATCTARHSFGTCFAALN